MSADNGVYVLETPVYLYPDGEPSKEKVYRVMELMNIEDCNSIGAARDWFGDCKVFASHNLAMNEARRINADNHCEYGIQFLHFDSVFSDDDDHTYQFDLEYSKNQEVEMCIETNSSKPGNSSPFWIVWNESGKHSPKVKHASKELAEKEAERLANNSPYEFFIMKVESSFRNAMIQKIQKKTF